MLSNDPKIIGCVTYTWCFRDNVFSEYELKKIIEYCAALEKQQGEIKTSDSKNQINNNIRISEISWVNPNFDSDWFFNRILNVVNELNKNFYGYELYGFNEMQYSEYNSSCLAKYDDHMDMFLGMPLDGAWTPRKLSVTLLLSDDFEGGEFEFYGHGNDQPQFKAGTLIVFPSFLIHKVKPVTKGIRHSLVAWCVGPKFK